MSRIAVPRDLRRPPFLDRRFSYEKMRRLLKYAPSPDFRREVAEVVAYIIGTPGE